VANTPRTISKSSPRTRWAPSVSDVTLTRVASVLLWVLIAMAALGGLKSLTSSSGGGGDAAPTVTADSAESRMVAAGFAERYVTAYLQAGRDGSSLAPFLGYKPELPGTAEAGELPSPVRTVEVVEAGEGYWAVTVSSGATGSERFWRAAIEVDDDLTAVAVGLPSPVAGPKAAERTDLAVTMSPPSLEDPLVVDVTGFLSSYLCGQGDLSRYLSPGTELTAVNPPVCTELEITRWGAASDEEGHQTVVVDVQLDTGAKARIATYSAAMTRRDGRWEIAELLPAPPRESDQD
jgi:hypothetical protein